MGRKKLEDLTGRRVGDIIVLGHIDYRHRRDYYGVICACSIGKDRIPVFEIGGIELRRRRIKSCGCNRNDKPLKQSPISCLELDGKMIYSKCADKKNEEKYMYSWATMEGFEEGDILECIDINIENCIIRKRSYRSLFPDLTRKANLNNIEKKLTIDKTEDLNFIMSDIDSDSTSKVKKGYKFQTLLSLIFQKMNYITLVNKLSHDQGIDLIVYKNGQKLGIQAKCSNKPVTSDSVREVKTAIAPYKLDHGIVITNNIFCDSAKELAKSNSIILWDRSKLIEKISELLINDADILSYRLLFYEAN